MNACKKVAAALMAGTSLATQVLAIVVTVSLIHVGLAAAGDHGDRGRDHGSRGHDHDGRVDDAGGWGKHKVGSDVIRINLTGTAGEPRPMDVLLFYPADRRAYQSASPVSYSSRLYGKPLIDPNNPGRWVPVSFAVPADGARHRVPIHRGERAFPLIIFSHAAMSDPQTLAPTLERLASHGYVIAAPWHEGDTQDDRVIDVINGLAGKKIVDCFDAGASPCLDPLQKALQNRALDIAALLDEIPSYFGDRVDMQRVGMLGQSRGSPTALAAAGGSTAFNITAEPRIGAIMMLAIGAPNVTFSMDLGKVTIPALFIASKIDRNTPMAISVGAFGTIPSAHKGLVILERAEHGVYAIDRCAKMQATGATFQAEPRAIGEQLFLENIMLAAVSGTPIDYCNFDSFVEPVDIRPVVKTMTGVEVTENNVPRQLDTVTAMRVVLELANSFYRAALLKRDDDDNDDGDDDARVHFKRYLEPEFLLKKEGAVVSYAETQTLQGRAVACDDPELRFLDHSCP